MIHLSSSSRRQFLKSSSLAAAGAMILPASVRATSPTFASRTPDILVPRAGRWSDPDRHTLAAAAMDAARAAGASYADGRLSRTLLEEWTNPFPAIPGDRAETHGVGVRVLVNGYWGFLGSATWTMDEMARLARGAVMQAKANALGRTRELSLAPAPSVVNGEWVMPIKYDPFDVPYGEKYDFFNHVLALLHRHGPPTTAGMTGKFTRTDTVFASSEGSSWAQTTYISMGGFGVGYGAEAGDKKYWNGSAGTMALSPAGRGWEHFIDSGVLDLIPQLVDEAEQSRDRTPVDVGRYDLVCTAECTAALIDGTVGAATELDRALGYEANADGTSYLDQPLDMLGTYTIGSSLLNVTANRSHPGGCATVKWDDEAVVPDDFTLVKDGVLVDYQTTRAQVNALESYYSKINRPLRSHGCASSERGSTITMETLPNVQMMPDAKDTTFDELVHNTGKGVALVAVQAVPMDPQQLNGMAFGTLREIRNGKLGRFLMGAAVEFRAPNLWKSLDAIGGPSSTRWIGLQSWKGEPRQSTFHSVGAVPARFKNVAVIDFMRKA